MSPPNLDELRARYLAAYDAYQELAKKMSEQDKHNLLPSPADLIAEAEAIAALTEARRLLLKALVEAADDT